MHSANALSQIGSANALLAALCCRRLEEARKARLSGADSLYIKAELISAAQQQTPGIAGVRALCEKLQYLCSGDD